MPNITIPSDLLKKKKYFEFFWNWDGPCSCWIHLISVYFSVLLISQWYIQKTLKSGSQGNSDYLRKRRFRGAIKVTCCYVTKMRAESTSHDTKKPWVILLPSTSVEVLVGNRVHVTVQGVHLFAQNPPLSALFPRTVLWESTLSSSCCSHVVWMT